MPNFRARSFVPALLPALLALLLISPGAHAQIRLEGVLDRSAGREVHDVRVEVSAKAGSGEPRTLQIIHIAKVAVSEGRFQVVLDTGLEAFSLAGLIFRVEARPSESYGRFRTAEVSRVTGKGSWEAT